MSTTVNAVESNGHIPAVDSVPVVPAADATDRAANVNGANRVSEHLSTSERMSTKRESAQILGVNTSGALDKLSTFRPKGTPHEQAEQILERIESEVKAYYGRGTRWYAVVGKLIETGLAAVARSVNDKQATEARAKWMERLSERCGRFIRSTEVSRFRKTHALTTLCPDLMDCSVNVVFVLMSLAKIRPADGAASWAASAGSKGRKFASGECLQFCRRVAKEKWSLKRVKDEFSAWRHGKLSAQQEKAAAALRRANMLKRLGTALNKFTPKGLAKWLKDDGNADLVRKLKEALA